MSKVYVVGMGTTGTAIAFGLRKLGHNVRFVEPRPEQRRAAVEMLEAAGIPRKDIMGRFHGIIGPKFFEGKAAKADLVVSAAPFFLNKNIAKICANNGIRYADLGGSPEMAALIHDSAKKANVFTDIGLAPGHVNILAEHVAAKHKPHTLLMYCGGLPKKPNNQLQYNLVFSVQGLVNEYSGQCDVLSNGEYITKDTLGGLKIFPELNLEAFYTRGGFTKSMNIEQYGVQTCSYKTLRYVGHLDYIRFLMEDCGIVDDTLCDALAKACPPTKEDVVRIIIQFGEGKDLDTIHHVVEHCEHWTAMQRATGFPAAAVAGMMADGLMDGKVIVSYSDVDWGEYMKRLEAIDGEKTAWEEK